MKYGRKEVVLLAGAMFFGSSSAYAADLSLQAAIDMALAQNTALRITQKAEATAEESLREARGRNGVNVSASDSLSTSKNSDSERSTGNSISIDGSLPLYTGGANEAAIRSGEIGLDAARLSTERERENLKLSVIQAYYTALEAKKTIGVRQETVDKYQEHLENVQQLYAAGAKARIDVIDTSVQLSNARQDLIKSENAYEVDLAKLRNYLNLDRSEPIVLTTDFSYAAFPQSLDRAVSYAYGHRVDLIADRYKYEQKSEALKEAKAGYAPTVSLGVGAGQSNSFEPRGHSSQDIRASVSLQWNIFDSGVTRAKVQSADNDLDVAQLTLERDRENIDYAVREAYYNMREAEKRFNSTEEAVKQAEENYYIAREKYRAGEGLMLDITDAQESLARARMNAISAQYDYARYKAALENAMGMELTPSEREAAVRMTHETCEAQEKKIAHAKMRWQKEQAAAGIGGWARQEPLEPAAGKAAKDRKDLARHEQGKDAAQQQLEAQAGSPSSETVARELAGEDGSK